MRSSTTEVLGALVVALGVVACGGADDVDPNAEVESSGVVDVGCSIRVVTGLATQLVGDRSQPAPAV